jgi:chemotaxis protein MotA|tara:strand:+ start:140 stop:955 length:816 start_codon:yes stop_codon:yes gene_type:complete
LDIATILGLLGGITVVVFAIGSDGNFAQFVNVQGFVIVIGGTFAATMIKFPVNRFFVAIPIGIKAAVSGANLNALELIQTSLSLSKLARSHPRGLLVLENELKSIRDPFFRKGLQMCADGRDGAYIREFLNAEMDLNIVRQESSIKIFFSIAEAAPAFGMFGTLVGLIQMLSSLEDPTTVGKGLAVALLTTMYGVLISYLFAQPIAEKLDQKLNADSDNRILMIECVVLIQRKQNPTEMWDFLEAYLPENLRHKKSKSHPDSKENGSKEVE